MSDEQAEGISGRAGDPPAVDPALFWRGDVRRVLAALDIGGLYRVLGAEAGLTQRQIAACTGQSQSEVSDIVAGRRRVESHSVLRRIAESVDIPRELMGLSWWGPEGTYCGEVGVAQPPVMEGGEVRRRALIATTTMVAFSQVVAGVGELTEVAVPTGQPLPQRLSMAHVHAVEAVTEQLRGVARRFGGQGGLFGVAAQHYAQWLKVCRDGHPDDALKCFQLGQFMLGGVQLGKATPVAQRADDPRIPTLTAWLSLSSATAYALMDHPDQATRCLAVARGGWAPRDAFERAATDRATAGIQLDLGRLDLAESFAAGAVRTYGEAHGRERTMARLLLAEVHVRAGEPRGLLPARQAVEAVSTLHSVAVRRQRLVPLITALEARPGNDAKEVARLAHQVIATRL